MDPAGGDAIGAANYSYTPQNRLYSAPGAAFAYDGLGRLYFQFHNYHWWDYDGERLLTEIAYPANAILRRYVYGPGIDEPLVQYEGSGTTDRRWFHADERGSIVAISDALGAVTAVNRYDEYGAPAQGNTGRYADERGSVIAVDAGGGRRQPLRASASRAKWASTARRMPSAICDWPSGEWM